MAFDLPRLDLTDRATWPTRRDEEWKYSDLSRALGEGVEAPHQTHDRLSLEAGATQTRYEVIETPGAAFSELEITLAEGASLTRVLVLDTPADAITLQRVSVVTAPGSVFRQIVVSTGSRFQRIETHVLHAGHGASVELNGAYLLGGQAHCDLTTRVQHIAPDGVTRQLTRGLVRDRATGVFQGRILVDQGADGTDAQMQHQALILSDGARVRAKPELEIYADDVQCAHGNTIGALDEAALFFCQARGMPEPLARALLTQAFVLPVVETLDDEAMRKRLLAWIETRTEAFHGL